MAEQLLRIGVEDVRLVKFTEELDEMLARHAHEDEERLNVNSDSNSGRYR